MEDIDYAKYILNKYIKFDTPQKKAHFIQRLKKTDNNTYTYQLTNALMNVERSANKSNESSDRDTTLLDENKKLKEENESLKEQLQLKTNMYESLKSGSKHLKQQIKNKDLEIKNLQYDLDILTKKYNNLKNGEDIRKGISLLEMDSDGDIDSSSDEEVPDPANELYGGL